MIGNYRDFYKNPNIIHKQIIDNINKNNCFKIALIHADKKVNYLDFKKNVIQLANLLHLKGVKKGDVVGVLLDRDFDLIYTIFAVSLLGATYLPLSPLYPDTMIDFVIKDSGMGFMVTKSKFKKIGKLLTINLDILGDAISKVDSDNLSFSVIVGLDDLSYIIYTSGTTGVPKGVAITHKSLINDIYFIVKDQIKDTCLLEVTLFSTNICFDQSVEEIYPALFTFNTVVIVQDFFDNSWVEHGVTLAITTPSVFLAQLGIGTVPNSIKGLVLGGERLTKKDISEVFTKTKISILYNSYGPTECTDQCAVKYYTRSDLPIDTISIGSPISNTNIYILDESLNKVKNGHVGEIYISGDGVAYGYVKRPELNKKSFIKDPFCDGFVMYKSGDLGVFLDNGEVRCLGRVDNQLKVNGIRIESESVEAVIKESDNSISKVFVIIKTDLNHLDRLVAYVTPKTVDTNLLLSNLKLKLPTNYLPHKILAIEEFPMTLNGKMDVYRLPLWDDGKKDICDILKPNDDVELKVLNFIKEVLSVNYEISMDSNFYDLGGHSILAAQLISKVNAEYKTMLNMTDFVVDANAYYLTSLIKNSFNNKYVVKIKKDMKSIFQENKNKPFSSGKILVVGAGMSGIKTALLLKRKGIDFDIIDKNKMFGGIWIHGANSTSKLQTPSFHYNLEEKYKYKKLYPTRNEVIEYCKNLTEKESLVDHFIPETEILDINYSHQNQLKVTLFSNHEKKENEYSAVIVCTGRYQKPYLPRWANNCFMTHKACHACDLDKVNVEGKDIVVVGAGSYAIEAFCFAYKNKAKSVTLISRKTYWILPNFADALLDTAIDMDTLKLKDDYNQITNDLKLQLLNFYIKHNIEKLIPDSENSNFGIKITTSDEFFKVVNSEKTKVLIDEVGSIFDNEITLKSGNKIAFDYMICATGYYPPKFDFLNTITNKTPYLYKGYLLLNEPRIGFVGLQDDFVSFIKPLDTNVELVYNSISDLAKRPSVESVSRWIDDTPYDLITNYKTYLEWIQQDYEK